MQAVKMGSLEDILSGQGSTIVILALVFFLAVAVLVLAFVVYLYRRQQKQLLREDMLYRDIARRRRIKASDKEEVFERDNYTCQICGISREFMDSYCPGLGDYLLLEADHIRSVERGGRGDDIDNLQCLCWRCNRKKGGRKTNEEVMELLDYGIDYLDPEDLS